MPKTSLGEANEQAILLELSPIIEKFAKRTKQTTDGVQRSVIYLWESAERESAQEVRDYLSACEIGPFGGR